MKNFTRILALVAAVFAVSCTTDATEDLGVQLGNNAGQTTISLSLEGTKTHLGEKAGDEYPLYWSAGDQIAVNGVASQPLTDEAHGKVAATFTLNGDLTYPYNIVYPAPAEGVVAGEGLQAVTFLANQEYKAGTFAEGAAPLYAQVVAEGNAINLQHLSGVLCFAPKGEGVTLTSMTVTAENGKLAGNFDVNCADGTLVAHDDATNTVTVSFGEGLTLGAEATPIYVAVPAGEYGVFTVTLNTATDSMAVKFNSDGEKAIKAGVVRKFTDFAYAPDSDVSEIFEIYDEASLRRFAALATTFAPRKGAKVTASIDMTDKEWTPIEGFGAYTFDGGSDKGFEIKGLSAPLFNTTSATITNVNLVDVDITETERTSSGSLVCVLSAGGSVSNCSVSGKYTYNKVDSTMAGGIYAEYCAGGLVGRVMDATVTDSSSSVAFSVVSVCESLKEKSYPSFGGVIGAIENTAATELLAYNNLTNNGALSYDGVHGAVKVQSVLGGVVGYAKNAAVSNLVNNGTVNVNKQAFCLYLGGVVGATNDVNFATLENKAALTVDAQVSWSYMGGVVGQINGSTAERTATGLINRGKFTTTKNAYINSNAALGGVIGVVANTNLTTLTNSHNYGDMDIDGKDEVVSECRIGGIIGSSIIALADNCSNRGNVSVHIATAKTYIGGLVGLQQTDKAGTVQNCENHGAVEATSHKHSATVYVGGIVGYNKVGTYKNNKNLAAVTFSGSTTGRGYISGGVGASKYALTDIENEGAVTISADSKLAGLCFGGAVGYSAKAVTNLSNSGVITYSGRTDMSNVVTSDGTAAAGTEVFCVGGVVGWAAAGPCSNITNKKAGTLNVGGYFTASLNKKYGYTALGGACGRLSSGAHSKIHNYADVTYSSQIPNASWNEEPFPMGGTIGYVTSSLTDISNAGNITYSGSSKSDEQIRFSGVYGRGSNNDTDVYTNITNTGTITVSGTSDDQILVSGINSYNTKSTYNNVVNKGEIIITESAKTNAELYVAGVFVAPSDIMSAAGPVCNTGKITCKGTGTTVYVGGVIGKYTTVAANTCVNIGDIVVERPADSTFPIYVGGIVANATVNIESAKSYCNIQATGEGINFGWITGVARSETVVAKNCELGGMIVTGWDYEDAEPRPKGEKLDESNYMYHIYGSSVDWTDIEDYDGCKFLSVKPTIE